MQARRRMQMLTSCYQGRLFAESQDAAAVFVKRREGRLAMRASATPQTAMAAARQIVHYPCRERYTVVTTTTETVVGRVLAAVSAQWPAAVVLLSVVAASAAVLWRTRCRR